MPLTQLPVGSAFCLPEDLALNDYSFCLSKAYWRFDWERQAETAGFHPVIVVHLEQSVSFKLPFLGGVVKTADSSEPKTPKTPKPKDKDGKHTFSCAVDLPDSLVNVKSGFVKYFGDGKNKTAKLTSLGLSSLRRSMVLDAAGVSVPGFPLVMVQLPFKLCPKLTHLSGQEMYQGWSPQESWFWEQPQEYLKKFLSQASKQKFAMLDFKRELERLHQTEVHAWPPPDTNTEVSISSSLLQLLFQQKSPLLVSQQPFHTLTST